MIYKCQNCGGNVIYDPVTVQMVCPHCDGKNCQEEKYDHAEMTVCPECGGALTVKEHTSALMCEYCESYIILDERVEKEYLPNRMIPFRQSKDKVKQLLRERFSRLRFAPTDFLSEARLNKMQGNYVPFWLYDYDTACFYNCTGIKQRSWVSGSYEYTERSYYEVARELSIDYRNIPADASIDMPDAIMDLMEPYDYSGLVAFDKKYLSGFMGEKYNMPKEELEPRAKRKMDESARQHLNNSVSGYSSTTDERKQVVVRSQNAKYDLFPVWKYDYTYKGKEYPFYINGQTGKIVGKVPTSITKVFAYSLTVWASLTAMLLMVAGILSTF